VCERIFIFPKNLVATSHQYTIKPTKMLSTSSSSIVNNGVSGLIDLVRKNGTFQAGYGLVNEALPRLLVNTTALHAQEQAHLGTLKHDRRRQSYLLGRIAAKLALGTIVQQPANSIFIDRGIFEFPVAKYIGQQNVQVAISHCGDIGISLAYPEAHPMAVDIERVNEGRGDVIKNQLTDSEIAMVGQVALQPHEAYTLLWTVKEALSKIFKTGLMMDLKVMEVKELQHKGSHWESFFTHCGQYKAHSRIIGEHAITVVLPKFTDASLEGLWQGLNAIA